MTEPSTVAREPRRMRFLLLLGVGAVVVVLALAAGRSYHDLERARARDRELADEIVATKGRLDQLDARITRLRTDSLLVERLAREELGLVKPGDVVIQLPTAASP
ncbi:MAG: septum formation initiator family protein [Thermoanaerobaculia bacterium]|nr:septum formation initiator family protein [Thermoanaerobaculia bacterium]